MALTMEEQARRDWLAGRITREELQDREELPMLAKQMEAAADLAETMVSEVRFEARHLECMLAKVETTVIELGHVLDTLQGLSMQIDALTRAVRSAKKAVIDADAVAAAVDDLC
jgi:hypothetical protein